MLWRSFKKIFSYEIVVILFFIICYIICRYFNITCLFYALTKVPCPTCYMGRALIFLMKGDIENYIIYNLMAIPVAFVFVLELLGVYCGKFKRVIHVCSVIVLTLNMLYYLLRINFVFQ